MKVRTVTSLGALVMAVLLGIGPAHSYAFQDPSALQSIDDSIPSSSGLTNPCPEGEFLDLDVDSCLPLVKSYGFDAAAFLQAADTTQHELSVCSQEALEDLLDGLPAAGGVVNLPACTITLLDSLSLPSNVVLQGAGIGQTTIKASQSMVDVSMIRAKRQQNLVVRDLTVDGSGISSHGILIWYSANALVERVEVFDTFQNGVSFRYAEQLTIRYIESRGNLDGHGISSKDCRPEDPAVPDLQECQAQAGETAPGVLWSRDYAVYSNHLHYNSGHGIDLHAAEGEAAGNSVHNNGYGTKFPDSSLLWIHHNEIFDNSGWGLHIYSTLEIPERAPKRGVMFKNSFSGNADYPVRVANPSLEIFLLDNLYSANSPNELRVDESEIFVCPGTQDAEIELAGEVRREATPEQCDLSRVGDLFNDGEEPAECLQLTLTHTGGGSDPLAAPYGSSGCAAGSFVADEAIALSATPNAGWEVGEWSGTDNDGSSSTENSLTMPAYGHLVSVAYIVSLVCFPLTLSHSGNGADPVASPVSSTGCSISSYTAGELVALVASPADGWEVVSWSGTVDDGSTLPQNSLTMPASGHVASVTYGEQLFVPNRLVFQNTKLSGTKLYEACISIKVGPKAGIVSGAKIHFRAPEIFLAEEVEVADGASVSADTSLPVNCSA